MFPTQLIAVFVLVQLNGQSPLFTNCGNYYFALIALRLPATLKIRRK
jgi:hypothetical protein